MLDGVVQIPRYLAILRAEYVGNSRILKRGKGRVLDWVKELQKKLFGLRQIIRVGHWRGGEIFACITQLSNAKSGVRVQSLGQNAKLFISEFQSDFLHVF